MMPTITGGIAHGTSARVRASQRIRSGWLSSDARPSARKNWMMVTPNAQIRPIRNDCQNSASCQSFA